VERAGWSCFDDDGGKESGCDTLGLRVGGTVLQKVWVALRAASRQSEDGGLVSGDGGGRESGCDAVGLGLVAPWCGMFVWRFGVGPRHSFDSGEGGLVSGDEVVSREGGGGAEELMLWGSLCRLWSAWCRWSAWLAVKQSGAASCGAGAAAVGR